MIVNCVMCFNITFSPLKTQTKYWKVRKEEIVRHLKKLLKLIFWQKTLKRNLVLKKCFGMEENAHSFLTNWLILQEESQVYVTFLMLLLGGFVELSTVELKLIKY